MTDFTGVVPKELKTSYSLRAMAKLCSEDKNKDLDITIRSLNITEFYKDLLIPIQVSCNKFSMAVLLKYNKKSEKTTDEFKDFKGLFYEIRSCLKSRDLSFQAYFLHKVNNDMLYHSEMPDSAFNDLLKTCYISEHDFIEKLCDLLNYEKYGIGINKLIDKLKNMGDIEGEKGVDIFQFYHYVYDKEEISNTKLMIIGDFAKNWYNNWNESEYKNNWKNLYESKMIFELPHVNLPLRQVELGENHLLMLTVNGEIFSCGDGSNGATGNGVRTFHSEPVKVKVSYDNVIITKIAAGGRHSLAVDASQMIYSWGCGANGRLGNGSEKDQFQPKIIDSLSSSKIAVISAGDTYSACVTSEGSLFTWGHGEFGRLGHEEDFSNQLFPKVVDLLSPNVVDVKCGYYCTIVYVKKPDSSKLEIHFLGTKATSFIQQKAANKNLFNAEGLPTIKIEPKSRKVEFQNAENVYNKFPILAVCGYQYIALISEESHYYIDNPDGEEQSVLPKTPTPMKIHSEDLKEMKFCDIYLSGNINLTINKFGTDFYRLLPDGMLKIYEKLSEIRNPESLLENRFLQSLRKFRDLKLISDDADNKALKRKREIRRIRCSDNNTAVLSDEGDVYVFGSYLYKIASEEVDNYNIPMQPKGTKVISVGLGANHIIMVTNNYDVFGAGRNLEGQLGLGKPSNMIDISNATLITKLKNKGINKCLACENYTLVKSFSFEAFIFGDISFLEKSQFIHHQSSPKQVDWGEVYKIALGPSHIIMMARDEKTGLITMKAIGNGTYGKLGDDAENEDNRYEPVNVDIQLPSTFTELDKKKGVILKCSRYSSACLIKIKDRDQDKSKLFIWGLCAKSIFNNPKDLDRYSNKPKFFRQLPLDNAVNISKPVQVTLWTEGFKSFALSDNMLYIITGLRNELKYHGTFYSLKRPLPLRSIGEFGKIALGIDHAAAVSLNRTKLFTWGFNVMNKLGFQSERENGISDFSDVLKHFVDNATNVTNFNKIFDANKVAIKPVEEKVETKIAEDGNDKEEEKNIKRDENQDQIDSIFTQTQMVARNDFEILEDQLLSNEIRFKNTLKNILLDYKFLMDDQQEMQKIKRGLYNHFNFKMGDPPLNIKTKDLNSTRKLPYEYQQFKRNYKCLVTTLKLHPCYIAKLYENEYFSLSDREMCPKELYRIIKQLYFNIYDDRNSQILLIVLAKKILEIDIKQLLKKCKDDNDKKNVLENYYLYRITDNRVEFNLFAKICKLIFKSQLKFSHIQEILAMYVIGYVYSKTGGKGVGSGFESAMLVKYHPELKSKKKQDLTDTYTHQRNQRIDTIFSILEEMAKLMVVKVNEMENKKNPIFTLNSKRKINEDNFVKLPKICKLLINEIINTLEKIFKKSETDKIIDWISKRFPLIIFDKLLKILENPRTSISVDAGLLVDKISFHTFMRESMSNFYSYAYVLRFCLGTIGLGEKASEMGDDEVNKLIEKKFNNYKSAFMGTLKEVIMTKNKPEVDFDMMMLKEFFKHSLEDKSQRINFSLYDLRRLQEVIVPNIDEIRILSKEYDFMDFVFFNKKNYPDNYIGQEGGLMACNLDKDDNLTVQMNIRTRLLAFQSPNTLMKCRHCSVLTLHDFVLSNETVFYKEFKFFDKSSICGRFLRILKNAPNVVVRNDKITDFLKEESAKKDSPITDSLYNLITLIVLDDRKNYLIPEEDIADPKLLFDITLRENQTLTDNKLKDIGKKIIQKYEKMKLHKEYHETLSNCLDDIRKYTTERVDFSRKTLFTKVKRNFEKGYGNPDILENYKNLLKNSSKMIQLQKYIDDMPKSKNLLGKLTKEKKDKLLPFRDYELKKLVNDRAILKITHPGCDADMK